MSNKWSITEYFIDAKESIDSMWYISSNTDYLKNLSLSKIFNSKRSDYYINCAAVLDKSICNTTSKKKTICNIDSQINHIYYERDKHYAHKDFDYISITPYKSLLDEVEYLKKELIHVFDMCRDYFPIEFTIDFVCFDSEYYRIVNHIDPNQEDKLKNLLFPLRNIKMSYSSTKELKIIHNSYELNQINDLSNYCTLINGDGLTLEERLQKLQKSMILTNITYNTNLWVSLNKYNYERNY